MIIKFKNASKISIFVTVSNKRGCESQYQILPTEEKQIDIKENEILLKFSHGYSTKVKLVTKIVVDLKLIINDTAKTEHQIDIYRAEKFAEKGSFIIDFLQVKTDSPVSREEFFICDSDNVRNQLLDSFAKQKKNDKRFDRIWPLLWIMGGSTFVVRQLADGWLFIVLLVIDYILIFLLNKLVDKIFKIDKGTKEQRKEKLEIFDKLCNSSYLYDFIKAK